jgi:hypothetical protein
MPWLVPSHQALVLPLKRWRPAWFSGLALVLGSLAPDLVFILRLDENGSRVSHTLAGQLFLTVPMVFALHALVTALVLPWLLPHLPGEGPLHLHALARSRPARDAGAVLRVAFSGLVGGLTHVFLDGFTHGNHAGWAVALLPALRARVLPPPGEMPLHDLLQVLLTIVLGAAALGEWRRYARRLAPPGPGAAAAWEVRLAPEPARRAVQRALAAAVLAGAVLAPAAKGAYGTAEALKLAAYGAITGVSIAAVALAAAHRARRAFDVPREGVGRALGARWAGPSGG